MREPPTIEDLVDLVVRMEEAGWQRKGFKMERGGHCALIAPDGTIKVTGPGDAPSDIGEILSPPGDGKWRHDA